MSTRVAPRRVAACLAAMLATFVSVPRADTWRALIVYTNEVDSVEGYQPLYERYLGIFDEINDLYDSSGMVGRAEIAGVIWDKEYVEEHPVASLYHLTGDWYSGWEMGSYSAGGLEKYIGLLEKYAADLLILRGNYGSAGLATQFYMPWLGNDVCFVGFGCWPSDESFVVPPVVQDFWFGEYPDALGYGVFVVGNDDAMLWTHEAGHVHGLGHPHGLRLTFDSAGLYTESSAVSGFHTVMEYAKYPDGMCGEVTGIGDMCFPASPVFRFSNPDSTFNHSHPYLGHDSIYPLGTHGGSTPKNSALFHDTVAPRVRDLHPVPSNLVITEDMTLESYDYADFLATNSVTIEPGFRVEPGARMRITIGSQSLAKRGAVAHGRGDPSRNAVQPGHEVVSNFLAQYDPASRSLRISFETQGQPEVSLAIFDVKGSVKRRIGNLRGNGKFFSETMSLGNLPNGAYFIRVTAGVERFHRRFVKW